MGNWQNWLSSWARWWNIPNKSHRNQGTPGDGSPCTYLRRIDPHGVLELVLEPPRLRLQPVGVPLAGHDEARPVVLDDAGETDLLRLQTLSAIRKPPEGDGQENFVPRAS